MKISEKMPECKAGEWKQSLTILQNLTNERKNKYSNLKGLPKLFCYKKLAKAAAIAEINRLIDGIIKPKLEEGNIDIPTQILKLIDEIKKFSAVTRLSAAGFKIGIFGGTSTNEKKYIKLADHLLAIAHYGAVIRPHK